MTHPFQPELGQIAATNTPWQEFDADMYEAGLRFLGQVVKLVTDSNPSGNVGGEAFTSDVFDMRAYCWCDGLLEGHEEGCPPNFVHHPTGLQICWYKYLGRGMSANMVLPLEQWCFIVGNCLEEVYTQRTYGKIDRG